jgi:membrane protease YdiL (CAAX protease family)
MDGNPPMEPGRASLLPFFALTYAIMWTAFGTVAIAQLQPRSPLAIILIHLGAYSPSLVALWLTHRRLGGAGVRALIASLFKWQVPARYYVFAIAFYPTIKLTAALLHNLATGAWPRFGADPWYLVPVAIAFSTPFQAGEEIGWRGYALPRLTGRFGLGRASLLLGVIWGAWHLPQFFIRGGDSYGQSFVVYVLQVIALSVVMAWLYARSGGSLLLVMLLHAAVNNFKDVVPSAIPGAANTFTVSASLVGWFTLTLLWICAAYCLRDMRLTVETTPTRR